MHLLNWSSINCIISIHLSKRGFISRHLGINSTLFWLYSLFLNFTLCILINFHSPVEGESSLPNANNFEGKIPVYLICVKITSRKFSGQSWTGISQQEEYRSTIKSIKRPVGEHQQVLIVHLPQKNCQTTGSTDDHWCHLSSFCQHHPLALEMSTENMLKFGEFKNP